MGSISELYSSLACFIQMRKIVAKHRRKSTFILRRHFAAKFIWKWNRAGSSPRRITSPITTNYNFTLCCRIDAFNKFVLQTDLPGRSLYDIIHPHDVDKVKEQISCVDLNPRHQMMGLKCKYTCTIYKIQKKRRLGCGTDESSMEHENS